MTHRTLHTATSWHRPRPRAWVAALVGAPLLLGLVAQGPSQAAPGHASAATKYYVSLGDSYSVGYQPSPTPGATSGFTGYVAKKEKLTLANFGCGGATTDSILHTDGCTAPYGPTASSGAVAYTTQTQAAAAESFISAHASQIGLITVSIGGNDVTSCAAATDPTSCVAAAVTTIQTNVTMLADGLRAAAGPATPIIGLTYPDVILGEWVFPSSSPDQSLATLSVTAFKTFINPALSGAYGGAGGAFVDVTSATGAYIPLTKTTNLAPYGKIPKAVAEVCQLTWFCQLGNIHANTKGYQLIGKLITKEYAKLPH